MMNMHYFKLLLIAIVFTCFPSKAAELKFPTPEFFKLHIVADHMSVNYIDMSVAGFDTIAEEQAIYEFYSSEWDGEIVKTILGEWHILSHMNGDYLYVVQYRDVGLNQKQGYLSISDLPTMSSGPPLYHDIDLPLMPGNEIFNRIESDTINGMSTLLIVRSERSLISNLEYVKSRASAEGWQLIFELPIKNKQAGVKFQRGNVMLDVVFLSEKNETYIQYNQIGD